MNFLLNLRGLSREVVLVKNYRGPNETRQALKAVIQGNTGMFPVNTPIYEGDVIELPDPRGGVRRLQVGKVDIRENTGGGVGPNLLDHIAVTFTGPPA